MAEWNHGNIIMNAALANHINEDGQFGLVEDNNLYIVENVPDGYEGDRYSFKVEAGFFVLECIPVVGTVVQGVRAYNTQDKQLRYIRYVGTFVSGVLDICTLGIAGSIYRASMKATQKQVSLLSACAVLKVLERGLVEVARGDAENRRLQAQLQATITDYTRPLNERIDRQDQKLNRQGRLLENHTNMLENLLTQINGDGSPSLRTRHSIQVTDP